MIDGMKKIGFWFCKAYAYWNANLPFPLLYLKSSMLSFVLYHLIRYRRKVVRENLTNSFPEKSTQEIKQIERRFYRNFCDIFVEMCKLLKVSMDDLKQRVSFTNAALLNELYRKGKNVLLVLPHSSNWEWFWKLTTTLTPHRCAALYKPMKNPYFNDLVHHIRTRGIEGEDPMIEDRTLLSVLEQRKDTCNLLLFLGDQSPRGKESDYWTDFLHRDTCWYTGIERVAKNFDYAVVYGEMVREGRGRYAVNFKLLVEDPGPTEEGFVLKQYVSEVERFITQYPDNWLWSHRRWKHSRQKMNQ